MENMDTTEASNYLTSKGIHTAYQTLCSWRFRRTGPPWRKVGKRVFYRKTDLDIFIEGQPPSEREKKS